MVNTFVSGGSNDLVALPPPANHITAKCYPIALQCHSLGSEPHHLAGHSSFIHSSLTNPSNPSSGTGGTGTLLQPSGWETIN